ncbi:hypothetical protein C9374_001865 [Naegleria lovaniensis]|uniref:Uncharacterized protein n=1 Tax=Naegleria lovaniensis TaxID=51637 RepID=A0AA88KKI4_NAELO|nr:uncharacterized protein C9374_001865 [Naegleria lovaniensis]KAG2386830.1 hypothetical protein C9374_001865 [Naegleria lovaniensis]
MPLCNDALFADIMEVVTFHVDDNNIRNNNIDVSEPNEKLIYEQCFNNGNMVPEESNNSCKRKLDVESEVDNFIEQSYDDEPMEAACKKKKLHQRCLNVSRIYELGDDMIYQILSFLDYLTILKNCMRVSKQWFSNGLRVPISIKFMNKLCNKSIHSVLQQLTSNQNKINITGLDLLPAVKIKPKTLELIANSDAMNNLRRLNFNLNPGCSPHESIVSLATSKYMSNLTELQVENITAFGIQILASSANMNQLKKLAFIGCGVDRRAIKTIRDNKWINNNLTSLTFSETEVESEDIELLLSSELAKNLKQLVIECLTISENGIKAIAESSSCNLTDLGLSCSDIGQKEIRLIATSPNLRNLTRLDLTCCNEPESGVKYLAESPYLKNLRTLMINDTSIKVDGIISITTSQNFSNLTELHMDMCDLLKKGVQFIANSSIMRNLKILRLNNNLVSDGLISISHSEYMSNLRELELSANDIETPAIITLCTSKFLKNLTRLDLSYNNIGSEGGIAIANSENMKSLRFLNLEHCEIGSFATIALANCAYMARLTHLNLAHNEIENEAAIAVSNSPYLQDLTFLNVERNRIGFKGAIAIVENLRNLTDLCLWDNKMIPTDDDVREYLYSKLPQALKKWKKAEDKQ